MEYDHQQHCQYHHHLLYLFYFSEPRDSTVKFTETVTTSLLEGWLLQILASNALCWHYIDVWSGKLLVISCLTLDTAVTQPFSSSDWVNEEDPTQDRLYSYLTPFQFVIN